MGKKKQRRKTEHVAATSPNMADEVTERLRELVPEAFSEGKIDFAKLRATLGDLVDERPERYVFSWAGKRDAIRLLQTPSRATLVPCPDESVNWETTQHLFIEGENLEVLKLLYKSYAGRVKMIYIDPPYNTGHDFIYPDNFADPLDTYLRLTGQADEEGNLLTSNPETFGRYHSAWLSMMYPRLFIARQLLRDDGVIFISINDAELHNLRGLCNEVFGEENWLGTIVWKGATDNNPTQIAVEHEYILCYAKSKPAVPPVWKNRLADAKLAMLTEYRRLRDAFDNNVECIRTEFRRFVRANSESLTPLTHYNRIDERGPYTGSRKVHNPKPGGYKYDVIHPITKKVCIPPANGYRFPKETMDRLLAEDRILFGDDESQIIQIKEYLEDYEGKLSSVITLDSRAGANEMEALFGNRKIFPHPKPSILLRDIFDFCLGQEDLVLDFFAGSCSTAHAVLDLNSNRRNNRRCRFIMVQLPEPTPLDSEAHKAGFQTIADIGKERIRKVIRAITSPQQGTLSFSDDPPPDLGFRVFKLMESHYARWRGTAEQDAGELEKQMEMFTDPLTPGWDPLNVIYEILLKEGYSLTSRIEEIKKKGLSNTVYTVTDDDRDQSFMICLDDKLAPKTPRLLELTREDLFICRDVALADELAANLALQCRLKTI